MEQTTADCKWKWRHNYMKIKEGRISCKLCGKDLYEDELKNTRDIFSQDSQTK